jgi:hypothetical protein
MESDNTNIMNTYFTEQINNYTGTLQAYSNYSFNRQTYVTKFTWNSNTNKLTNKRIEWLNKDINGNPLNPTVNVDGSQILKTPGYGVVTWGVSDYGGTLPSGLSDVVSIYSTGFAFAALKSDGSVFVWGDSDYGGNSSLVQNNLSDVVSIYSTDSAFAALKSDGVVVTWGNSNYGGDSSAVQNKLSGNDFKVINVYMNYYAFAALIRNYRAFASIYTLAGSDLNNSKQIANIISSSRIRMGLNNTTALVNANNHKLSHKKTKL